MRAAAIGWVALACALGAGCGGGENDQRLNVLILTLDTTRADRFGCYGYEEPTTPNFDGFARERAVRFDQAATAVPITLPSHTTIMTGTYPVFHGVHDNDGFFLDDRVTTLAELLQADGVATGAVVAAVPLDSEFNLDQGFDHYNDKYQEDWTREEIDARTELAFGFTERTADRVNLAAFRWIDEHPAERFFLWMHYFDPHQTYQPPPPYDSNFPAEPYDGEIAFVDENFGRLLDGLEARGLLENTIIIVVGDHGESLDQHSEPTHAAFVYDTTMRVPLFISVPSGGFARGGVIRRQVRTVDLAPTVLDLLGLPVHPEMQGVSLVPDLRDPSAERETVPALLESRFTQYHFGWSPLRSLRTDRWKYILAPKPELYDLENDPAEQFNLASSEPDRVAEMDVALQAYASENSSPDPARSTAAGMVSSVQAQLEALGYLTGGDPGVRAAPFPTHDELAHMTNPADTSLVLHYVNATMEYLRKQDYGQAAGVVRRGLEVDPENSRLRVLLARGLIGIGQLKEALVELDRAATINPSDAQAHVLMGRVFMTMARFEEARDSLLVAVDLEGNRAAVLESLASTYGYLAEYELAVETFRRALELDDTSWTAWVRYADTLAVVGRLDDARTAYQEALARNPYSPELLDKIARFYVGLGDLVFARHALEQAVRTEPGNVVYRFHLAAVLMDTDGAQTEARQALEEVVRLAPDSQEAETARQWLAERLPEPSAKQGADG